MSVRLPRVALVYDSVYPRTKGGGERRFFEIGRRLSDRFDITYFFHGSMDRGESRGRPRYVGVGGSRLMYAPHGRRSVTHGIEFALRLARPLIASRPDVIDCSSVSYAAIPVCAAIARLCRARLVVTWHEYVGTGWGGYLPGSLAAVASSVERIAPHLSRCNVAVSRFTARRLLTGSGVGARVIPNGIDWATICAAPPHPDGADIMFVGRLVWQKRVDLLLDAIRLLPPSVGPLQVMIVGDGPERPALERALRDLPRAVTVRMISSIETDAELFGRMKASRILVLPSIQEGYGLVVAEAQACGAIPLVVSHPNSAATDLVTHGETGLVCEARSSEIAQALGLLATDDALCSRLRERAQAVSSSRDWGNVSRDTAALFDQLVAA